MGGPQKYWISRGGFFIYQETQLSSRTVIFKELHLLIIFQLKTGILVCLVLLSEELEELQSEQREKIHPADVIVEKICKIVVQCRHLKGSL